MRGGVRGGCAEVCGAGAGGSGGCRANHPLRKLKQTAEWGCGCTAGHGTAQQCKTLHKAALHRTRTVGLKSLQEPTQDRNVQHAYFSSFPRRNCSRDGQRFTANDSASRRRYNGSKPDENKRALWHNIEGETGRQIEILFVGSVVYTLQPILAESPHRAARFALQLK
jgi:hypothetical protein